MQLVEIVPERSRRLTKFLDVSYHSKTVYKQKKGVRYSVEVSNCVVSMMVIPLIRSCRAPISVHARNLWDFRPLDVRSVIRDMDRQMEHLERAFFRNNPLRIITPRFMPIEGKEANQDSSYRVNIDVQGFKPEDIKISLKEGVLKIEASMDKKAEDGSRFQQSIVREFTLPSNVEASTVKSLLHEDGILTIEAQVNKLNQPTDIPIQHLENGETPKSKM